MQGTGKFGTNKKGIWIAATAVLSIIGIQAALAGSATEAVLIDKDIDNGIAKFCLKVFCRRIDASDDQTEKLTALVMASRENTRPQREQLRHGILDLSSMMAADDTTDQQIKDKISQLRALHDKVADERIDVLLKARTMLTKDQRQKINQRVIDFMTGNGGRWKHRIGFGDIDRSLSD